MPRSTALALLAAGILGVVDCGARTSSPSEGGAAVAGEAGDAPAAAPRSCAPSASTSDLVCASVLTYYWDGTSCKPLVECYCNNIGCACRNAGCTVFASLTECQSAYASCH
jgi:hypothetical protein